MRKYRYELKVISKPKGDYRLELWEPPPSDTKPQKRRKSRPLSSVQGWYLQLSENLVRKSLRANKYKPSDLKRTRKVPFRLSEEDGIKLDLAFRTITGLRLRTRMEDILHGIQEMSREEALYWHAKVSRNNGTDATNALIALRVLLGGKNK